MTGKSLKKLHSFLSSVIISTMALPCYVHNLCLHRSLQNCYFCPYKIILLHNSWYLKKEHSSHTNSNSGNSSGTQHNEDSQEKPQVSEVVTTKDENTSNVHDLNVLEEPTTCCMSGCANCVWIEYAEELSKRFKDGGEKAREAILKISDPNMRAFLLTELKTINKS